MDDPGLLARFERKAKIKLDEVMLMAGEKTKSKEIRVTLTQQDYDSLSQLARETERTMPGYMRWLLHEHLWKKARENGKQ